MKILKEATINDAMIKIEDREEDSPENRYTVVWRSKDEENRYSARSFEDAEEYYGYRYHLAEQRRIERKNSLNQFRYTKRTIHVHNNHFISRLFSNVWGTRSTRAPGR